MTTQDVLDYYPSAAAVGRLLGLTRQAVSQWGKYPPRECQLDLQQLTSGNLVAESRVRKAAVA